MNKHLHFLLLKHWTRNLIESSILIFNHPSIDLKQFVLFTQIIRKIGTEKWFIPGLETYFCQYNVQIEPTHTKLFQSQDAFEM